MRSKRLVEPALRVAGTTRLARLRDLREHHADRRVTDKGFRDILELLGRNEELAFQCAACRDSRRHEFLVPCVEQVELDELGRERRRQGLELDGHARVGMDETLEQEMDSIGGEAGEA